MTHVLAVVVLAVPHADRHGDPLPPGTISRFGTVRYRVGSESARYSFALAPDGKHLAVEGRDGIRLWDTDTGRVTRHLPWRTWQGTNPKFALAFSPDGRRLARVAGRVVAVWDLTTGREVFDIDYKEEGEFQSVAFVPGKDQLYVTADQKPWALTLDGRSGKVLRKTEFEKNHWALQPAGPFVLDRVGYWGLFDPITGKEKVHFPAAADGQSEAFVLSPEGKRAWIVDAHGRLQQFDVTTGERVAVDGPPPGWKADGGPVAVALDRDGSIIHIANGDRGLHRRDVKAGRWLEPLPDVPVGALLPLPNGKRLLVVAKDGILHRYDLATRKELPGPEGFEDNLFAFPSPNGRHVAIESGAIGRAERLDMFEVSGKRVWSHSPRTDWGVSIWSPDGRRMASAGRRRIIVHDPGTGDLVRSFDAPGPKDFSLSAFFSPGSDRLIVPLDGGKSVFEFDLATGERTKVWEPKTTGLTHMSPDGRTLLYREDEKGVRLFDLAAGRFRADWIDPPEGDEHNPAGTTRFTPDGSYLVTWELERPREAWRSRGVSLVLRDARTGARRDVHELSLPTGFVWAVSPDGLWMTVGYRSGAFDLFDVATGHQLGRWEGHRDQVSSIGFVGPGRVLTGSADLTALVWDLRARAGTAGPVWEALTGRDGTEAWRAVWSLAADPDGPDLLRSKIKAVPAPPADRVRKWLAELGADRYAVREAATKELQALGRLVEPDLWATLEQTKSEEVRTRLDGLLGKIATQRTPAELVAARAVAALEAAGTPSARMLLAEWAAGAPGARLTIDAKAALGRSSANR